MIFVYFCKFCTASFGWFSPCFCRSLRTLHCTWPWARMSSPSRPSGWDFFNDHFLAERARREGVRSYGCQSLDRLIKHVLKQFADVAVSGQPISSELQQEPVIETNANWKAETSKFQDQYRCSWMPGEVVVSSTWFERGWTALKQVHEVEWSIPWK